MILRPYQERVLSQLTQTIAALRKQVQPVAPFIQGKGPHPCGIVAQMATGAGKTATATTFIKRFLTENPGATAQFWADLKEINNDTLHRFQAAGLDAGLIAASAQPHQRKPGARVQVVQVQTATAKIRNASAHVAPCDLLILDEAHICEQAELQATLRAHPPHVLIGITATPSRGDGKGMSNTFVRLIQGPQTAELQRGGYLVGCDLICPARGFLGDALAMEPARAYVEHAPAVAGRKSRAIIFCGDTAHAKKVAGDLREMGIPAEQIGATTRPEVRKGIRERLLTGETLCMVTVDVGVKGLDAPVIDTVIIARGVTVPGVYLQMIGRALRPHPETRKTRARVIDLRGCVYLHGLPEEERVWSLSGEAVRLAKAIQGYARCEKCAWLGLSGPSACPRCGTPLGRPEKPPRVLKAEKLAKLDGMSPEQRRQRYEAAMRWQLSRRAGHAPKSWHDKKIAEAMIKYDEKYKEKAE